MQHHTLYDDRLGETYYPPHAAPYGPASPTDWLCPACQNKERDTNLDHDARGYVCPECGSRYDEGELARSFTALLSRLIERLGEVEGDLDHERREHAITAAKLDAVRRAAA